jgi:hypothetical protein
MPLDTLRRLFGSKGSKKGKAEADPQKPTGRFIEDDFGGKEYIEPYFVENAMEITSKPLMVRNKTAAQVAEMIRNPVGREPTERELRRLVDSAERLRGKKYVRTSSGAPITTGDGSMLQFGSDDPQPMMGMKKGGKVKSQSVAGGASKRGDGIAQRGKTKGRFV